MSQKNAVPEGILMGIGNSLLDITVLTEKSFLDRFNLLPNNAIIAGSSHRHIYDTMMREFKPAFLPGGATQNSIRVAQWLLQTPKATTFFGSVGDDKYGEILKKTAESVGVNVLYEVIPGMSTGRCGAVITGEDRSLVTELGAAQSFHTAFLEDPDNWKYVMKAQVMYIGGFFLPVSIESVLKLLEHAVDYEKTVIMNLHATFLCKIFADKKLNIMQYVDVLFGNGDEALELSNQMGFKTADIKEIAKKTSQLPKLNTNRGRVVIFTQGRDPTIVAQSGEITEYPIVPIDPRLIKDTNGCGDAFVGGFMSQLAQGKSIKDCLRCGFYASKVVIQHFGCNYPDKPDFV